MCAQQGKSAHTERAQRGTCAHSGVRIYVPSRVSGRVWPCACDNSLRFGVGGGRGRGGISSFVPLGNVREGARDFGNGNWDFGNEKFHCGSIVITVYHRTPLFICTYPAVASLYALTYPAGHICTSAAVRACTYPAVAFLYALTYPAGHTCTSAAVRACTCPAVAFLYALTYPAGHIRACAAERACTPLCPFCTRRLTLLGTYVRAPLCAHVRTPLSAHAPRCGLSVCADLPCWALTYVRRYVPCCERKFSRYARENLAGTQAKI